ncbi:unnamed protein product, partial [Amoebophrya sp. A25]
LSESSSVQDLVQEKEKLGETLLRITGELAEKEAILLEKTNDMAEKEAANAALAQAHAELETTNATLQTTNATLQSRTVTLESDLAHARNQLAQKEEEFRNLEQRLATQTEEIEQLQQKPQVEAMLPGTSKKIVAAAEDVVLNKPSKTSDDEDGWDFDDEADDDAGAVLPSTAMNNVPPSQLTLPAELKGTSCSEQAVDKSDKNKEKSPAGWSQVG